MTAQTATVRRERLLALSAAALGVFGWAVFAFMSVFALTDGGRLLEEGRSLHFDWHVYATGAADLVERELYRVPLVGPAMPVDQFNLPPMSALWAVPLLPLPLESGGYVWQVMSVACLAAAAVLVARATNVPRPMAASGIALGVLALNLGVIDGIVEGTNNYLVLLVLAAFSGAYMRGNDRWAGVLLGLAVATKVWPIALAVLLLRERRWTVLRWSAATLAIQAVGFLAWLGPDVLPRMVEALTLNVSTVSCCGMIGAAELRDAYPWWPPWGAAALAVAFVAAPARGRTGLGLGMLAGLFLVPNLWMHYLPTVAAAVALVVAGTAPAVRGARASRVARWSRASGTLPAG